MKYKVVEMLNCMTGDSLDKFIEDEKLIPILEKHKFPLSRIKVAATRPSGRFGN